MPNRAPQLAEPPPGPALGGTLGLIALGFLAVASGGYSGAGFQIGLVLLPVGAAVAWASCNCRSRWATIILLLLGLSGALLPVFIHPGRLLWYYAMHIAWAWVAVWVLHGQAPQRAQWLLPVITGSALVTAGAGWLWFFLSAQPGYKIAGTFGLHNAYAGYLLLAWPAAAIGYATAKRLSAKVAYGCATAVLCLTLLFTLSRAAWLVFFLQAIGLGVWLVWRKLRQRVGMGQLAVVGGALGLLIIAACVMPVTQQALASIANSGDYSLQGRLRFWQAALEIFARYPLMGVGPGNFAFVFPQFQPDWRYYSVDPHSWPLQLLCELGVPGLLLICAILAGLWLWLRRLWRYAPPEQALLLSLAVLGSLAHAAVDFDYTFGATTALLGALLAYGTHLAQPAPETAAPATAAPVRLGPRLAVGLTVALWLLAALAGQALTLERYTLDRLDSSPSLTDAKRVELYREAIRFVPYNFRTHYKLAALYAKPGREQNLPAARKELAECLHLNPLYALGWAMQGRIDGRGGGEDELARALQLDPYNYPEHYFFYASLAQDDAERLKRLKLGLERIPLNDPIPPEHIRPTWYQLNPLMVEWYKELARLEPDEQQRQLYARRETLFEQYWKNQLSEAGALPQAPPDAPERDS